MTIHKRLDLQGMRAFAVLAVFAGHLFHWPSGGFVGVDVFFVLSGFFITGVLIRERTSTGRISFSRFYVRRVRRIIPSALLVLVLTTAASYLLLTAPRARSTLIDSLWASIFLSNWRFQQVGTEYFAIDQAPSPVLHYWSLSIEEQFYFVWPVLLLGIFAVTRRYSTRSSKYGATRQTWLMVVMSGICAASFGLACHQLSAGYFSTFTRIWELGIGALLAIAAPVLSRIPTHLRPTLSYIGLTGAVASLFLINEATPFPGPWTLLPTLSTALVIAAFVGVPVRGVPHLTNRVAGWFGDSSYTLYLWHWPVLILLEAVLPQSIGYYVAVVIVAMALTAVTYHFYEDPIRRSAWLAGPTRIPTPNRHVSALIGIVAVGLVAISLVALGRGGQATNDAEEVADLPLPTFATTPARSEQTVAPLTAPLPRAAPCFGAPAMTNDQCALRDPDVPLTPSIDDFATDGGDPYCWTERDAALHSCTYGYRGPDATRVALVGDSHGNRILVAIAPYLTALKWQLTTYLGWGCAWKEPAEEICARAMTETKRQLLADPYDLVVTTTSREFAGEPVDYARALRPVGETGTRIAVIADNPEVSDEALRCLTMVRIGSDHSGDCGTPRRHALANDDPLVAAANRVRGATVIDLTQYYCTNDFCPAVIGDVIVYSDVGAHLTATYARTLAPAIIDGMRQALAAA